MTSAEVVHPITGEKVLDRNVLIGHKEAELIATSGIDKVNIRSVLTCDSERGVCANCYGINLTNGQKVDMGEAVGVIAAQSIGEPGTQLTLRTFHIGGTAARIAATSQVESKAEGTLIFENIHTIGQPGPDGEPGVYDGKRFITIRRNGLVKVIDDGNRIVAKYSVPYGATLLCKDGQSVAPGDVLSSGILIPCPSWRQNREQ